jgi:hypothetical protein
MLAAVEIITPKVYAGLVSAQEIKSPTIDALSNRITTEVSSLRSDLAGTNAALQSLSDRVAALEAASSTSSFSPSSMAAAVSEALASAQEWIVGKITASVGVFTRLCVGSTCIEEDQLKALLNQSGQLAAPAPAPSGTSTPDESLQSDSASSSPETTGGSASSTEQSTGDAAEASPAEN